MNPLKKLLGQTAIYGVSSIVGRIINFLLVPLYTNVLDTDEYGVVILMYSYVAVIYVFIIYGMETSFFRYSELINEKKKVYNTSLISLLISSFIFAIAGYILSPNIAEWIKLDGYTHFVKWFILIMALDAIVAIPFAKLRADNKPVYFASIKLINIGVNLGLNLFFILLCPFILNNYFEGPIFNFINLVFDSELGLVSYVFISNLIASIITLILLLPEILKLRLSFDFSLWKQLLKYGYPLLLIGFAFAMNEMFGRIVMSYLLPEDIALHEVGIYSASYKLAILLSLFVQAFRYAAEPFFFSQSKEKDAKKTYALVMKYFVIIMAFAALGILLYLDIIQLILGREFRGAIGVVPVLLIAYIFIGIFYNLSVWYKLTNKTIYGAFLALGGTIITVVVNFILIPKYGYWGSAWATFSCYFFMMIASYIIGRKKFEVKYDVKKIAGYLILACLVYYISTLISFDTLLWKMCWHTLLMLAFVFIVYLSERKQLMELRRM